MQSIKIMGKSIAVIIITGVFISCSNKDSSPTGDAEFINQRYAMEMVEALARQFTLEFSNMDSLALAGHYASDGMLGTVKGHENIISTWHRMIKNGIENGTPELLFKPQSITTDKEYIVELGIAQWADESGEVKKEGKYIVVYKFEDGELKLYRDWGL